MTATTKNLTTSEIAAMFRNNETIITESGFKVTNVQEFGRSRGFVAYYVEGTKGTWWNDEYVENPAEKWGLTYDEGYEWATKTRHEAYENWEVRV